MVNITRGAFSGGFAKGQMAAQQGDLQSRRIGLAERQLAFDEQQKLKGEASSQLAEIGRSLVEAKGAFTGGDSEAFFMKHKETLNGLLNLASRLGNATGAPGSVDRLKFELMNTPTAAERAVGEANLGVAGQAATSDALQSQGVPEGAARSKAFGLPEATRFDFVPPEELVSLGFPESAIVQRNAATGEVKVISDGGTVDPSKRVKIENDLRDDFTRETASFDEQQQNFLAMRGLAGDESGASDVALVFSFFKTIDPTSVVREGEFATAARAQGLPDQIVQQFARLDNGEILSPDLRGSLVSAAGRFFGEAVTDQLAREDFFAGLATRAGAMPGNVVRPRVRPSGRFATMSIEELSALDVSALSSAEKKALDAELTARGF